MIRLHRIQALKQLGYSLTQIRSALNDQQLNPVELLDRQIVALDALARQTHELSARLRDFRARISSVDRSVASEWLDLLEMTAIHQKHLTADECRALRNPEGSPLRDIDALWNELIDCVETAMREGWPIESKTSQELGWRWIRLVIVTSSNDAKLAAKLMTIHVEEERARDLIRIDPDKIRWISEAFVHARMALLSKYLSEPETAEVRRRLLNHGSYMTDWPLLVARIRDQIDSDTPPDSNSTLAIAREWRQLFLDSYCGEDKALEDKINEAFRREPDLRIGVGIVDDLVAYIQQALEHLSRQELDRE